MDGGRLITIADIFNAPTELAFEGKTYKLRQPTQIEQGEYVRWLEQLAYDKINARTYQSDQEKFACLRMHDQDCAAGVFDWGADVAVRRIMTAKGLAKLLTIVCKKDGLDLDTAERLVDFESRKIAAIMASKVTTDPNALGAILATLGLPANHFSSASGTHPSATNSTTSEASPTIKS